MIVAAFIFATGFRQARPGEGIVYLVIAVFGKSYLRLGCQLVAADLIITPVTASNTARGGVIFPTAQGVAKAFNSKPGSAVMIYGAGYVSHLRWRRISFALSLAHPPL